ncbi:MAG: hypothetical protein Q9209_005886 [Squamulea sp. 1 TL-2023]
MPDRSAVAYFGAGPAPLPTEVLEKGAEAFVNFENTGLSLAEISHRSQIANRILANTKAALATLLEIPDTHDILFMHGGGSGEFSAVVFNMVAVWVETRRIEAERDLGHDSQKVIERVRKELRDDLRLDYLVTGSWSLKASQEAANLLEPLGNNIVNVAVNSRKSPSGKFDNIPSEDSWTLTPPRSRNGKSSAFVYFCDNETVDGVEFPHIPKCLDQSPVYPSDQVPVVADMSSNLLSRRVDISKYAVVFGGAQKNIGITDVTLVIVRKNLLSTQPPASFLHAVGIWSPPTILNWPVIAKNNSLYNTMPIFSIWIAGEVMRGLLETHKDRQLVGQEEMANIKARQIYDVLDKYPDVYQIVPDRSVRSRMNMCFRVHGGDAEQEKSFLENAEKQLLQGLKGHRSVGGIRISNYNAVDLAKVKRLTAYLEDFASKSTL